MVNVVLARVIATKSNQSFVSVARWLKLEICGISDRLDCVYRVFRPKRAIAPMRKRVFQTFGFVRGHQISAAE